jgi:hypothetical protein
MLKLIAVGPTPQLPPFPKNSENRDERVLNCGDRFHRELKGFPSRKIGNKHEYLKSV